MQAASKGRHVSNPLFPKGAQLALRALGEQSADTLAARLHQERLDAWAAGLGTEHPHYRQGFNQGYNNLGNEQRAYYRQVIEQGIQKNFAYPASGVLVLEYADQAGTVKGALIWEPSQLELASMAYEEITS